ncbi:hypothetical protein [Dietzia kunjamensis]|uniref:hypothetical protein n=1 Tax=Dietzia kunjamensis TaxID=322509 RepID=UPI0039BCE198
MTAVIGALTLVGFLGFVIALMTGAVRGGDRFSGTGSLRSHAVLESLVGAVAVATVLAEFSGESFGAATVGAALGLVSAIRVRAPGWTGLGAIFSLFYAAIGALAALIALISLFGAGCVEMMPAPPLVIALLVACIGGLSLAASFFSFPSLSPTRLSAVGLGWFAATETLSALASPVGLALFPTLPWYFIGIALFAIVVGLGLGLAPEPMFVLLSVAFLLALASTAITTTGACPGPDAMTMVVVLVSFLAVFVLVGMFLRLFFIR